MKPVVKLRRGLIPKGQIMRWRIKDYWYKFKCWAWYRYTTVKPRYLGHTWCDRTDLLPHIMFEILSRFVENECSPGHVDWYNEEWSHKIEVNGVERYVRDEIQALYDWWHKKYMKSYPELIDSIHELVSDEPFKIIQDDDSEYSKIMEFNPKDTKIYAFINRVEARINEDLQEKMIRLVKVRESLWT